MAQLPRTRMSPDSVAVQIAFVHLPIDFDHAALWREVDEQLMPLEARRNLNRNGFRFGLVGAQLPPGIPELLDSQDNSSFDLAGLTQSTPPARQRRIHCRAGNRTAIATTGQIGHAVVLHHQEGSVRGDAYDEARCVLAMRCFPDGHGGARFELTPEIEHGAVRQRFVPGEETQFQLEIGRDRRVFDDLKLEAALELGQSLVLTSTPEMVGLGRLFFVEQQDGPMHQQLVLIRLAQSQSDELFSPSDELP